MSMDGTMIKKKPSSTVTTPLCSCSSHWVPTMFNPPRDERRRGAVSPSTNIDYKTDGSDGVDDGDGDGDGGGGGGGGSGGGGGGDGDGDGYFAPLFFFCQPKPRMVVVHARERHNTPVVCVVVVRDGSSCGNERTILSRRVNRLSFTVK